MWVVQVVEQSALTAGRAEELSAWCDRWGDKEMSSVTYVGTTGDSAIPSSAASAGQSRGLSLGTSPSRLQFSILVLTSLTIFTTRDDAQQLKTFSCSDLDTRAFMLKPALRSRL